MTERYLEDFSVGQTFGSGRLRIDEEQIRRFASEFDPQPFHLEEFGKPVEIGSDVWVGGGAIILAGVRIGSRAVIGAGSVVTRHIPEGLFAAGNVPRNSRDHSVNGSSVSAAWRVLLAGDACAPVAGRPALQSF